MDSCPSFVSSNFSILFWNANSLARRIHELRDYLTENDVDIVLAQETNFVPNRSYNIPNYNLYRSDRVTPPTHSTSGGVAIYIKSCIPHHAVLDIPLSSLEATHVMVDINSTEKWLISSIYVRHKITFPIEDFQKIFNKHTNVLVAGDFNAHNKAWNCATNNRYGNLLLKMVTDNTKLNIIKPPEPTHYSTGLPSTIDLAITKNIHYHVTPMVQDLFDSDHMPVMLTIDLRKNFSIPPPRNKINWRNFTDVLYNSKLILPKITCNNDIDSAIESLNSLFHEAEKKASSPVKNICKINFPPDLKALIRERNRSRKNFQKLRTQTSKQTYYDLKNRVRQKICQHKQDSWAEFIDSHARECSDIWKLSKKINSKKFVFPPIRGENGMGFTDEEKANNIALAYEKQFTLHRDLIDPDLDEEVERKVENFISTTPTHCLTPTTPSEIVRIISKLSNKKAPGLDKISNIMLKNCPFNIIFYITKVINEILKRGYFPHTWKTAVVCAIPKQGDLTFPENYRPISLLSCLSKIAERVILSQLNAHIDANNIIIPEQFGFRPNHSTTQQLLRVVEFIADGTQQKLATGILFLDVAKAFDKVWHDGLILKLINLRVPDILIHLIYSYLCDRSFMVRINNTLSQHTPIESGVQQGSLLGPTLFNLYINDLPRTQHTQLAVYADDTAILSQAHHPDLMAGHIQHHIDLLEQWMARWKIKVNPSKCQAIYFSRKFKQPKRLYINDEQINWGKTCKYLGLVLDRRMTWRPHINGIKTKMKAAIQTISSLIFGKHLSIKNKVKLYRAIVIPVATYGSQIWATTATSNLKLIEATHNNALRRIRRGHYYMSNLTIRRDLGVSSMRKIIKTLAENFYKNIDNLPNELIAGLPDYDYRDPIHCKRPKAVLNLELCTATNASSY